MGLKSYLRNHSLSLTCITLGVITVLGCIPLREGTTFALLSNFGVTMFGTGLLFLMQGPLIERNKPEEGPPPS